MEKSVIGETLVGVPNSEITTSKKQLGFKRNNMPLVVREVLTEADYEETLRLRFECYKGALKAVGSDYKSMASPFDEMGRIFGFWQGEVLVGSIRISVPDEQDVLETVDKAIGHYPDDLPKKSDLIEISWLCIKFRYRNFKILKAIYGQVMRQLVESGRSSMIISADSRLQKKYRILCFHKTPYSYKKQDTSIWRTDYDITIMCCRMKPFGTYFFVDPIRWNIFCRFYSDILQSEAVLRYKTYEKMIFSFYKLFKKPAEIIENLLINQSSRKQKKSTVNYDLMSLSRLEPSKFYFALVGNYSWIAASILMMLKMPNPLTFALGLLIIGTRQHGNAALMHEGSHYRIHKNRKLNDFISNFFIAYPLFIETEAFRGSHQQHHSYLNTDKDPDWMRKKGLREWSFPLPKREIFIMLTKILFGRGALLILIQLNRLSTRGDMPKTKATADERKSKLKYRLAYYTGLAVILTATNTWAYYLLFWIAPLLTILPVLLRLRSIAEHFGLPNNSEMNSSRNNLSRGIEAFLFAPHNVGYHLAHSLYVQVPFYNLKKLHQLLNEDPNYRENAHNNDSYFFGKNSIFKDLTNPLEESKKMDMK